VFCREFDLTIMNEFSSNRKFDWPIQGLYSNVNAGLQQPAQGKSAVKRDVFVEKENFIVETNLKNKQQYRLSVSKSASMAHFTDQKNKLMILESPNSNNIKKNQFDTTYSKDYFQYLQTKEIDSIILDGYFSRQNEIRPESRNILVDYYVEIKATLPISMNAIFLATQFIDILLSEVKLLSERILYYRINHSTDRK
jgi:hypothetical protein